MLSALVGALYLPTAFADTTSICDQFFTGRAKGLCNAYCEATGCGTSTPSASANACSVLLNNFTQAGTDQGVSTSAFNYQSCTVGCPCGVPSVPSQNTDTANSNTVKTCISGAVLGGSVSVISNGDGTYNCQSKPLSSWSNGNQSGFNIDQANACVTAMNTNLSGTCTSYTPFTP